MILCHGQEKLGEAEAMYHQWALVGKERAVAELLVEKGADGVVEV
jgi:hypothetical protein